MSVLGRAEATTVGLSNALAVRQRAGALSLGIAAASWLALTAGAACALEVKVVLMGQAGIEDPAFEILLNDTLLGLDTVSPAAKSAQGEYLSKDIDLAPFTHEYTFELADADVPPSGKVRVRFVNDYYDGEKGIDANLYVVSVAVGGQLLDLNTAQVTGASDEVREQLFWEGALVLPWVATASIAYPEVQVGKGEEVKAAVVEEPAQMPKPRPVICANPGSVTIIDYPNGETSLSPAAKTQIDELVAKGLAGCTVSIAGYSSVGGPPELNLIVSKARSTAVEAYLRERAPGLASIASDGMGETDQFGNPAENRRVVVTVQ